MVGGGWMLCQSELEEYRTKYAKATAERRRLHDMLQVKLCILATDSLL